MDPEVRTALAKLALPIVCIVIPVVVARLRGFALKDFFGLFTPPARAFAVAVLLWIVWIGISELVMQQLGIGDAGRWPERPLLATMLRIVAIGILGPIAEELVFRGILYGRLQPRIGAAAAIILLAVVFGVIHIRYDAGTIAFVCLDGLLFGYARYRTGSVYTPMTMHALGNLFSIGQSLT